MKVTSKIHGKKSQHMASKGETKFIFKAFTLLSGSYRESFINNLEPVKEENIFFLLSM